MPLFKKHNPGCNCCAEVSPPCPCCDPDDADDSLSVTIAGVVDDQCTDCDSALNATHVLTRYSVHACWWVTTFQLTGCTYYGTPYTSTVTIRIHTECVGYATKMIGEIVLTTYTHFQEWVYEYVHSTKPMDCTATRSLPFKYGTGFPGFAPCKGTPTFQVN